jgi:hypothetical protein
VGPPLRVAEEVGEAGPQGVLQQLAW